jgi:hypothetical protein
MDRNTRGSAVQEAVWQGKYIKSGVAPQKKTMLGPLATLLAGA